MNLCEYIDHTNLKAYSNKHDIETLCKEAMDYHFASVCVNPYYVGLAHELLSSSKVKVCTVVGFPLGQNTISVKEFEAKLAIEEGAEEIDMVINIAALKDKDYDYVKKEIQTIKKAIYGNTLKVIIETCYLTADEIIKMTEICNETKADFIKTSTGFGTGGATVEDVKLMNQYKTESLKIKASGGIKNYQDALQFIQAGASRIGTSNGVNIMEGK